MTFDFTVGLVCACAWSLGACAGDDAGADAHSLDDSRPSAGAAALADAGGAPSASLSGTSSTSGSSQAEPAQPAARDAARGALPSSAPTRALPASTPDAGSEAPAGQADAGGSLPAPAPAPVAEEPLSFAKDIQPIFAMNCAPCHTTQHTAGHNVGGALPGAYADALALGRLLLDRIDGGSMPPSCDGGPGSPGCLSVVEVDLVRSWLEQRSPR